ncbi:TetR/AcrR family transcriptional regulator [Anaerostipes sp. MSJ-23]|uniref:TetR/AcrR family transcriptional regulator n=2 Tax=unclassified Anaerostipes TaxID=2635253 RepID=UPI001C102FAB|nr:TetR/AcrR family transcriptional regulator [Anaerostipes sp. MSJ-23]MBU5460769.1 TetR/AcrR family transcriptional regulator [Anaerostipes sp. MSJ-23]
MKKIEEKKKKKQNALLETAYKLFTHKGFQKTSIADIAHEAGVAKGTFYLYFKDKTDIHYKLIAHKAAALFKRAYAELMEQNILSFEDQIIFLLDQMIEELVKNPTLLRLISKHLGWGIFKDSLVEPIDDAQRNIYDIYMKLLKNSGHNFREPEVMIYMIIELLGGCCYNSILMNQPKPIDEMKPYLYETIRMIIKNHEI